MVSVKTNFFNILSLLAFVSFCIIGCTEENLAKTDGENSVLTFEPPHLDLGTIKEGTSKSAKVTIHNKSPYSVNIDKITVSCSCTSAEVSADVIQPRENSILSVKISPAGRRGKFKSIVNIEWSAMSFNKPISGKAITTFLADALYIINTTPDHVDFERVSKYAKPQKRILDFSRGTEEIGFVNLSVESESPAIETFAKKTDQDHWQIEVTLIPSKLPAGAFRSSLTVILRDSGGHEVHRQKISAQGEIKGTVSARPKSLFFGVVSKEIKKKGEIFISTEDGKTVEIKSIRTEPQTSILSLKPIRPAKNEAGARIEYNLHIKEDSGNLSGRIFIEFSDTSLTNIAIPFIVYVKEPD